MATWGFKRRDAVLEILEVDRRTSQQMSFRCAAPAFGFAAVLPHPFKLTSDARHTIAWFSAMMPLNRLNVTRESVEEGAVAAYRCIADMFAEGKWKEEQYRTHRLMDPGLALQFAEQAKLFKSVGVKPHINVKHVRAHLLYSLITFDELAPDFSTSWIIQVFGRNRFGRSLALMQEYFEKVRSSQPVCVQLFVHFRGAETVEMRPADAEGKGPEEPEHARRPWQVNPDGNGGSAGAAAGARSGDMDHVWTFEARISWDDFIYINQMPDSSPYGDPAYGTQGASADKDDEGPQFRWVVKDINAHMQSIGQHYRWNVRV